MPACIIQTKHEFQRGGLTGHNYPLWKPELDQYAVEGGKGVCNHDSFLGVHHQQSAHMGVQKLRLYHYYITGILFLKQMLDITKD